MTEKMAGMKSLGTSPGWKAVSKFLPRGRRHFPLQTVFLEDFGGCWGTSAAMQMLPYLGLKHLFLTAVGRGRSSKVSAGPGAYCHSVLQE